MNGTVSLTVTPPPGVAAPPGFPATATMTGGLATFSAKFPTAGYYRIAAAGRRQRRLRHRGCGSEPGHGAIGAGRPGAFPDHQHGRQLEMARLAGRAGRVRAQHPEGGRGHRRQRLADRGQRRGGPRGRGTSSKPTTLTSSGARRPRSPRAWSTPNAWLSLPATIAVGGSGQSKQPAGLGPAAGHREARPGPPGRSSTAEPGRPAWPPGSRPAARPAGPDRPGRRSTPIRRWPSSTR